MDQGLLNLAMNDLDDARTLYKKKIQENGVNFHNVCYHIQQCVEKCLKEILSLFEVSYKRYHDIDYLVDLLCDQILCVPDFKSTIEETTPELLAIVEELKFYGESYTRWESETRYNFGFVSRDAKIRKGFEHGDALIGITKRLQDTLLS